MTDHDRRLEVGKTYRAKNGASITVSKTHSDGDFEAGIKGDSRDLPDDTTLFYGPNGECFAIPRLDVDWDHPENIDDAQRSKAVKYDISKMKLIFDVKGKPELAAAIAARLEELGVSPSCGSSYTPHLTCNISVGHYEGKIHHGAMEVEDEMWDNYRLTTLDDLYNLDAWAEEVKPEPALPDKPSELLLLAVDDLEKTESMPDKYKVCMSEWHSPGHDRCYVCFAGGVMAQTMQVPPTASKRPFSYDDDQRTREKLLALDEFRKGDLTRALKRLDVDLGVEPPPVFPVEYRDDPYTFKLQMRRIAYWLERIGH